MQSSYRYLVLIFLFAMISSIAFRAKKYGNKLMKKRVPKKGQYNFQLKELVRLNALGGSRKMLLQKGTPSVFSKGGSQTESWLSQIGWSKIEPYLGLIDEKTAKLQEIAFAVIIPREKMYANDYFAFYHGQHKEFWVFYELQRQLYEAFTEKELHDFYFLRDLNSFSENSIVAQEWLSNIEEKQWLDHRSHHARDLLSVNISFPGNLWKGESSAGYYIHSHSYNPPPIEGLFYATLLPYIDMKALNENDKNMLNEQYKKLQEMRYTIESDTGLLVSIFIPKYVVDSVGYLSRAGGGPIEASAYMPDAEKLSDILTMLINNPSALQNIGALQARLLLNASLFADPNSGIKVFLTHGMGAETERQLKNQIKSIVSKIKERFKSRTLKNKSNIGSSIEKKAQNEQRFIKKAESDYLSLIENIAVDNVLEKYNEEEKQILDPFLKLALKASVTAFKNETNLDYLMRVSKEGLDPIVMLPFIEQHLQNETLDTRNKAQIALEVLIKKENIDPKKAH